MRFEKKFSDNFKLGRRGDFKWDIVIILLLGLVVLALILYFIFGEYFDNDSLEWENCRQSIILRNTLPDVEIAGLSTVTFKDKFPLKCKTNVVTIDYEDVEKAQREISETMVACWFLYGNGEFNIFPGASWNTETSCMYCARIHIDPGVRDFYKKSENVINIDNGLDELEFKNGLTYYKYLQTVGSQNPFQLISYWHQKYLTLSTKRFSSVKPGGDVRVLDIGVPDNFSLDSGDLFIMYHSFLPRGAKKGINSLLYFQERGGFYETDSSSKLYDTSFDLLNLRFDEKIMYQDSGGFYEKDATVNRFCGGVDGIPA